MSAVDLDYFCHRATGRLVYDFGKGTKLFEPWWIMVFTDQGIIDYYAWLSKSYGIPLQKGSAYGAHVSVSRGEAPPNTDKWGLWDGTEIEFRYSHGMRWTPYHAWVDVYCEKLNELRLELGYPLKPHKYLSDGRVLPQSFHLTVGRRA